MTAAIVLAKVETREMEGDASVRGGGVPAGVHLQVLVIAAGTTWRVDTNSERYMGVHKHERVLGWVLDSKITSQIPAHFTLITPDRPRRKASIIQSPVRRPDGQSSG